MRDRRDQVGGAGLVLSCTPRGICAASSKSTASLWIQKSLPGQAHMVPRRPPGNSPGLRQRSGSEWQVEVLSF